MEIPLVLAWQTEAGLLQFQPAQVGLYNVSYYILSVKIVLSRNVVHNCGALEDPENGKVSFDFTTFESVATYTCDSGFDVSGDSSRTCNGTGQWTGSSATCTEGTA